MKITTERLHEQIFRLSQRHRAGDHSCDELLGRLLDEYDRRAADDDDAPAAPPSDS